MIAGLMLWLAVRVLVSHGDLHRGYIMDVCAPSFRVKFNTPYLLDCGLGKLPTAINQRATIGVAK